jgi:hypothetical protein
MRMSGSMWEFHNTPIVEPDAPKIEDAIAKSPKTL